MAHRKPGSSGGFNGKIGDIVVYNWLKLKIGRSTPTKTTKKTSESQSNQRAILGFTSSTLSPLKEAINIGFASKKGTMTAMNKAVQYSLKHAVSGIFPDLTIDYAKILLSRGPLDHVNTPYLTRFGDNKVRVNWLNPLNFKLGVEENDTVHLYFYCEITRVLKEFKTALRSDGTIESDLNQYYMHGTIHGWMFLVAANGKSVSNSKYLGAFHQDKIK